MRSERGRARRLRRPRGDHGMVTAELAACLPVLVLVLGVALTAVSVVGAAVRTQDAAREAARALARGDPVAARRLAGDSAPGASMSFSHRPNEVVAVARTTVHPLDGWLPAFSVSERAVAAVEPADSGDRVEPTAGSP